MIEACERYEADWRAGQRPRIEEFLEAIPEPDRPTFLRELLAVELELRRERGERPGPGEYRARFPNQDAAVDVAFAEGPPMPEGPAEPKANRPRADTDRGLLLGLLALQNNFVDRDALLSAFTAWVADKTRPLSEILRERGALDADTYALLEALVRKHLDLHGGDPERSLAALSTPGPVRRDLERITDPDLHDSLARVAADRATSPDPDATATFAAGQATSPAGRFRILRFHDRGGLGDVFIARDEELKREVALKQIQDRHAHDPQSRSRFIVEAEITGGLEHPGIIPIYSLGQYDDGRPFYAMRFIKGDNLKKAIERFHEAEGPDRDPGARSLELRKLLGRFLDVCNAVAYAHSRGVLHRDLKPGNILLGPYGETLVVDWGLAKVIGRPEGADGAEATLRPASAGSSSKSLTGVAVGTPAYMSPEQAAGALDRLGPASDVYSLGATLYCLLTGQAPFTGLDGRLVQQQVIQGAFPPPRQVHREVAPALEAICLKAMSRDPEDRYPSVRALADALERWMADEPISAYHAALAHHEALAREHPEKLRYREMLPRIRSNLGNALHFLGRNAEAESAHRTAVDEVRALVEQRPDDAYFRERLAVSYSNLGWVLQTLGRRDEADSAYALASEQYELMAKCRTDRSRVLISPDKNADLFITQGPCRTHVSEPVREQSVDRRDMLS
jgi:serine/threonine protein kinase